MIAERKENGISKIQKKLSVSWSNKKEKKLKRKIKREKSQIVDKKRKNESIDEDDYNEIQKDFSLLKKLKKRKVKLILKFKLNFIFSNFLKITNR
jgi:molecular chaperone GrpE (heat shock protein)